MAILNIVKHYLLEKKFTNFEKKHLYKFIKKSSFYLSIIYLSFASIATFTNNYLVPNNKYAAILLSGYAFSDYDYWASPLAFLGSYPAWTLYFNSKGLRTDYYFNATNSDFKKILIDSRYQSIVLVGHGSKNSWRATDAIVSNYEIEKWQPLFTKKNGEWFQLSCASADVYPDHLGELVMKHKDKVYYYSGETAGNIEFITDALTGFRLIKYQTNHR